MIFRKIEMIRKIDFIIGGAQKCGTSALARYAGQHPGIYIPHEEMHYFDTLRKKYSLDWYLQQFSQGQGKILGEKTPRYIRFPEIAQFIKKCLPHVKMIFLLRNPVDRAYSHYWHMRRKALELRSFEGAVRTSRPMRFLHGPEYLERGMYARQLQYWFKIFGRDQILVIKGEDMKKDPQSVLKIVFNFIGADCPSRILTPLVHVGTIPRSLSGNPLLTGFSNKSCR